MERPSEKDPKGAGYNVFFVWLETISFLIYLFWKNADKK
jgi:hypothetical protein